MRLNVSVSIALLSDPTGLLTKLGLLTMFLFIIAFILMWSAIAPRPFIGFDLALDLLGLALDLRVFELLRRELALVKGLVIDGCLPR